MKLILNSTSQRLGGKMSIAFVYIALRINEFLSLQWLSIRLYSGVMVHLVSAIDLCSVIQRSIPLKLNLKRDYSLLEGIMLKYNNQMDSVVRLLGLSSIADTLTCYLTINKISFTLVFQFSFHCCDKRHSPENTSR